MSPMVTSMLWRHVLRAKPVDHGRGQLDARDRHPASGERQRDSAGADGELERGTVTGELGEDVDGPPEHAGVEHRGIAVVIPGGDVGAEVVLWHRRISHGRIRTRSR